MSQAAARKCTGREHFHADDFPREAMESNRGGGGRFAVLPIENSSAEPSREVYDLLLKFAKIILWERRSFQSKIRWQAFHQDHTLSELSVCTLRQKLGSADKLRFLEKHGDWQQISVNTAAAAKKS